MDSALYRKYLEEYIHEGLQYSDGSVAGVRTYLHEKTITGLLVRHRKEKLRALEEARKVFDEHRHWPLSIILSHLGIAEKS
jgi:hypothetical protein